MKDATQERMKHYDVSCFWCNKHIHQRCDTYNRQKNKYGHNCCKNCFGREQSFKDHRKRIALLDNPFKGKTHSPEVRAILSQKAMGRAAWNKGMRIEKPKKSSVQKWIEFRMTILQRDHCNCAKCGNKFEPKDLAVHHLMSRSRRMDLEFDDQNCVTLCAKCHRSYHSMFGVTKFTTQDFLFWINNDRPESEYFFFN